MWFEVAYCRNSLRTYWRIASLRIRNEHGNRWSRRWKPAVPVLLIAALTMACSIAFSEEPSAKPAYPLWDNVESVAEYAKKVNLPPTKTLDLGNGVTLELVLVPAGKFIMGTPPPTHIDEDACQTQIGTAQSCLAVSGGTLLILLGVVLVPAIRKRRRPQVSLRLLLLITLVTGGCVLSGLRWLQSVDGIQAARLKFTASVVRFRSADESEKPAHAVTLTQPFYMGKYDVTQEQYQAVIGMNPSQFKGKDNPVEMVSWEDAQAFCKKLTERTKQAVRLPTEAEWEYSCRAGTTTAYYSGDTEVDLSRVAWYGGNSNKWAHPVGQKDANAFGLYDMHGNVWQWCQDWYGEVYSRSPAEDPQGPEQGTFRVLRGGAWGYDPSYCRSASRDRRGPELRGLIGFRVLVP